MKKINSLELHLKKKIKTYKLSQSKFLVAFSGGLDSLSLLLALSQFISKDHLHAFYFHHGDHENSAFRNRAEKFCINFCKQHNISFSTDKSPIHLKSEEEMRNARYLALNRELKKIKFDYIVTAHHSDDLLETRFLRLLRGVGSIGLSAIKELDQNRFRPLLNIEKMELHKYVNQKFKTKKKRWIEDPSNRDHKYLRNWLRDEILQRIDNKQKGLLKTLGRSLENLAAPNNSPNNKPSLLEQNLKINQNGINRIFYLSLSEKEQIQLLAQYVITHKFPQLRHSQILEIKKRLDNPQNIHKFNIGGLVWSVDIEQINAVLS